jgi:hypothetical protein
MCECVSSALVKYGMIEEAKSDADIDSAGEEKEERCGVEVIFQQVCSDGCRANITVKWRRGERRYVSPMSRHHGAVIFVQGSSWLLGS